jgi:hypothetical protein
MSNPSETWAKRFGAVALVNALIAVLWLIVPLFVDPRISRTIAGGSVGTWGYLGFILFLTIGFGGFAGFAFLYYIVQAAGGRVMRVLAWLHLALMEAGTLGATALLGFAGYLGGITILEETAKGTAPQSIPGIVHQRIVFVIEPLPSVAIFAALAGLGVLLGIIAVFAAYRGKQPPAMGVASSTGASRSSDP